MHNLLKGGQGRTPEGLKSSALGVGWSLLGGFILALAYALGCGFGRAADASEDPVRTGIPVAAEHDSIQRQVGDAPETYTVQPSPLPQAATKAPHAAPAWKIEQEFTVSVDGQPVLVRCEKKLKPKDAARVAALLQALPELVEAYAEKKKLKIVGALPNKIILVDGPLGYRHSLDRPQTIWGYCAPDALYCAGGFPQDILPHEAAHAFFGDAANHGGPGDLIAEDFNHYCAKAWKKICKQNK